VAKAAAKNLPPPPAPDVPPPTPGEPPTTTYLTDANETANGHPTLDHLFIANLSSNGQLTLNSGDIINGHSGNNTLKANLGTQGANGLQGATIHDVQTVDVVANSSLAFDNANTNSGNVLDVVRLNIGKNQPIQAAYDITVDQFGKNITTYGGKDVSIQGAALTEVAVNGWAGSLLIENVDNSGTSQNTLKKVTLGNKNNTATTTYTIKGKDVDEVVLKDLSASGSGDHIIDITDSTKTSVAVSLNNVSTTAKAEVQSTAATIVNITATGTSNNLELKPAATLTTLGLEGKADVKLTGVTATTLAVNVNDSDGTLDTGSTSVATVNIANTTADSKLNLASANKIENVAITGSKKLTLDGSLAGNAVKKVDGSAAADELTIKGFDPTGLTSDGIKGSSTKANMFELAAGNYNSAVITGGSQADTFKVASGTKAVTLNGGGGNDVYNVAENTAGDTTWSAVNVTTTGQSGEENNSHFS